MNGRSTQHPDQGLPTADKRKLVHERTYDIRGYEREDGMLDVDDERPPCLALDAAADLVLFVVDVADDLFKNIFQRDDALEAAVLVDHQREVLAAGAEVLQLLQQGSGAGHEPRGGNDG